MDVRHYGRVVKAWDLKSHDASRVGSNPAGVEFFIYDIYYKFYIIYFFKLIVYFYFWI